MKIKTILADTISGSIGSVAGAMSSGGMQLRKKILTASKRSQGQLKIPIFINEANEAWQAMTIDAKRLWGRYGNWLRHLNQTDHLVKQKGWTAFNVAFVLQRQAGISTAGLLIAPPDIKGYRETPRIIIEKRNFNYGIRSDSDFTFQVAEYRSIKYKNTINSNQKGYEYAYTRTYPPFDIRNIPVDIQDGRYFFKFKRIENDGSISKDLIIKQDLDAF